jgi:hypothetical protein
MTTGFMIGDRITISGIVAATTFNGIPSKVIFDGGESFAYLDTDINVLLQSRPASKHAELKAGQVWLDRRGTLIHINNRDPIRSDYKEYPFYGGMPESLHERSYSKEGQRWHEETDGPTCLIALVQDVPSTEKVGDTHLDFNKPVRFINDQNANAYTVAGRTIDGASLILQNLDCSLCIASIGLLENIPPAVRWVNIYNGMGHPTREEADNNAVGGRIACVQVTNGEGMA